MKKLQSLYFLWIVSMTLGVAGCKETAVKEDPQAPLQTQEPVAGSIDEVSSPNPAVPRIETAPEKEAPKSVPNVKGPKILVTKEYHDFGSIGPATYHNCDFTFKNVGSETLKIEKVQSTCGCSVPQLKKMEYAPGEQGTVEVRFHAPSSKGETRKQLYIISNDPQIPRAQLELRAVVLIKVEVDPEEMSLMLNKPNAGVGAIRVKGTDDRPFSITKFSSTNNAITCDYNPTQKAVEFVLHPVADSDQLSKFPNGVIQVDVDHPQGGTLLVRYSTLPLYDVNRPRIIIQNVQPGQKEQKEVIIKSNYGETLEIAAVSSRLGYMEIIDREVEENALKLTIEISMPEKDSATRRYFSDELTITFENEQEVEVRISGWFQN